MVSPAVIAGSGRSICFFAKTSSAQNLTIRSTPTLSNGDGIDVDSSTHVLIENCDIDTGDDCISLKSGRGLSAVRLARPTEDVLIRNCSLGSGFAGIGIGSEMSGGIRDVRIENCAFPKGHRRHLHQVTDRTRRILLKISPGNISGFRHARFLESACGKWELSAVDPVSGEEGISKSFQDRV